MKKQILIYFLIVLYTALSGFSNAFAQVNIIGSGGAANGIYASLKAAFDALNLVSSQSGNVITITVSSSGYFEGTETMPCVLNQPSLSGWSSLTVVPVGHVIISGSIAAGNPLIDFNGADNVTFNGLNSGSNSLTISNTTVSAVAGTSTVKFRTDASNNTIINCTVKGSSSMSAEISGGTVYFAAGAVTKGNDNNIVSNCRIGPAGTNLPAKGIFSNGTDSDTSMFNSGIVITECSIFDYFGAEVQSSGVYITGGSCDFTISNNKFFQTSPRTQTSGNVHSGVKIKGPKINRCLISGNTFGYSSDSGTGVYDFNGPASARFYPIYNSTQVIDTTNIQGNTITGINCSGAVSGTDTSASFAAILVVSGKAYIGNISGNIIGSSVSPAAVRCSGSGFSDGDVYGIFYADTNSNCNISNNIIGGFNVNNTSSGGIVFYGIRANTSTRIDKCVVYNNVIGNSSAPVNNVSSSEHSRVIGIYSNQGPAEITENNVSYLITDSPNIDKGVSSSVLGIRSNNLSRTKASNVSQNTVIMLSNTNSKAAVWVTGISYNGADSGDHRISGNIIRSLSILSANNSAVMNGIYIEGGSATYFNNFISLGIDINGNSITNNIGINGINETEFGSDNVYCNSICILGSGVGNGNSNTYAFNSSIKNNNRKYRNNIFYNVRSNLTGKGFHYAVRIGGSKNNTTGLTIFNNMYYVSGNGGILGNFDKTPVKDLSDWQNPEKGPGQDHLSYFANPQFENPAVSYHISLDTNSIANNNGFVGTFVSVDIEGQPRNHFRPDLGADEFTGTYIMKFNVSLQSCPADEILVSIVDDLLCIPYTGKTVRFAGQNQYYIHFTGVADPESFWIRVQQKSSLKIWSRTPVIFKYDGTVEYDFTDEQTKEYSSNLIYNGTAWSMIGGDINQDDIINQTDYDAVNKDAVTQIPGSASGFSGTDINCDGVTDAADQAIVENNFSFTPVEIPPCP